MLKKSELKLIRKAYDEAKGHDLRLTDDAISAIVEKLGDGFHEMDEEEQLALFAKAESAFKGIAVSNPGISGLVSKLDAPFYAEMDACIEAEIKRKTSSVEVYSMLKQRWTKSQFDGCPMPGTDESDVEGTNLIPDIVEKKNPITGEKLRTVFIDDLVDATPKGKAAQKDMDDLETLKNGGSVPRFAGINDEATRKDLFKQAKQVRDGMRSMFRRAIALHHQLSAIEAMPSVGYTWIRVYGTNKYIEVPKTFGSKDMIKVTRGPSPLYIFPVDEDKVPQPGKVFTVTQVNGWKIAKAIQNGGTLADLTASSKPEPVTPEQVGEKMSIEVLDNSVVAANAKLANVEERSALRTRMMENGNDATRASYCNLYLNLRGFYQANEKWYEEYQNNLNNAEHKEKLVKAERLASTG